MVLMWLSWLYSALGLQNDRQTDISSWYAIIRCDELYHVQIPCLLAFTMRLNTFWICITKSISKYWQLIFDSPTPQWLFCKLINSDSNPAWFCKKQIIKLQWFKILIFLLSLAFLPSFVQDFSSLQHSVFKTKHLRSLVQSFISRLNWVEN